MIDLIDLTFEFGGRALYTDVNWHIKPGERIGLVGQNGTGKSTLLRVINGEYQASSGTIQLQRGTTIGFLNQDLLSYESQEPIRDVALKAFSRELQLLQEIDEIAVKLETDSSEKLIQQLVDKQHELDALDGYNITYKTEAILEGLGFSTADLDRPLQQFSGGWRMRVMLAKLLLQKPSLLMLDEPTNHLDLPSIEWLEEYLSGYEGTVIVVSHDRHFLDRMTNKTVEIAGRQVTIYPGNYSFFLEAKQERMELQQKSYDNQQAYIKQQERFIERFKAKASKASAAQSRVKLLDKLERIEAVEDTTARINLHFPLGRTSGKVVSRLENVSKSFGDLNIMENSEGEIVRGDKIALIGANGKGKSTLLRMVAEAESYTGKIETGHGVITAFYAQHQLESLNINHTLLEELQHTAPLKTDQELRNILGCFLFIGDDVFKKIKVLSGGEKARVALAKMLLYEANFLLLDEPTNHLDIQSINLLIRALQQYEGSFMVVSHDRYFVSQIANKIWWIEDHKLREYPGTFDEYNYWKQQQQLQEKENSNTASSNKKKNTPAEKPAAQPVTHNNNNQGELKKLRQTFEQLEKDLETQRKRVADTESRMADPQVIAKHDELQRLSREYQDMRGKLDKLQAEYEQIFEQLLALEA